MAKYTHAPTSPSELAITAGEYIEILEQENAGWWYARKNGKEGYVPASYIDIVQ